MFCGPTQDCRGVPLTVLSLDVLQRTMFSQTSISAIRMFMNRIKYTVVHMSFIMDCIRKTIHLFLTGILCVSVAIKNQIKRKLRLSIIYQTRYL